MGRGLFGGIYKITNKVNNKIYIGSSKNITYRWKQHIDSLESGNHHNSRLQSDWNKYGITNFTFEVIESIKNDDNLLKREQRYIDKYKSYNPEIGYNIAIACTEGRKIEYEAKENIKKTILKIDKIPKEDIELIKRNIKLFKIEDATSMHRRIDFFNENKKYSLTKKWYKNEDNIEELKNTVSNYTQNIIKVKSKEAFIISYNEYKQKFKCKGITKSIIDINDISEDKRNNIVVAVNLYVNSFYNLQLSEEEKIKDDEYALSKIIEFIYNNCDISKEIKILILNRRMYNIIDNFKNNK